MSALSDPVTPSPASATPAAVASRAERLLVATNRWALVGLVAAMTVLVIANVISRYVFSHSFPWVEELSRYLMIWAALLGVGPALRVGGHIAVETLPNALPEPAARVLRALLVLLMALTLVYLVWLGIEYARFGWEQETPVLGWSMGRVYLAVPIGCALALAHLAFVGPRWIAQNEWERIEDFDPAAL